MSDANLERDQVETLRKIAEVVKDSVRRSVEWGRARMGVTVIFSGTDGTGKTMAAELIAAELGLELYRIDLSVFVSKYIGETEKNLRRVFDAAEEADAILLFDEAYALFGKRSEVKDSHDRYANLEISHLLQHMEAYRGLAILATNRTTEIDSAFLRRIRFLVDFPGPDDRRHEDSHTPEPRTD